MLQYIRHSWEADRGSEQYDLKILGNAARRGLQLAPLQRAGREGVEGQQGGALGDINR